MKVAKEKALRSRDHRISEEDVALLMQNLSDPMAILGFQEKLRLGVQAKVSEGIEERENSKKKVCKTMNDKEPCYYMPLFKT